MRADEFSRMKLPNRLRLAGWDCLAVDYDYPDAVNNAVPSFMGPSCPTDVSGRGHHLDKMARSNRWAIKAVNHRYFPVASFLGQ